MKCRDQHVSPKDELRVHDNQCLNACLNLAELPKVTWGPTLPLSPQESNLELLLHPNMLRKLKLATVIL